MALPQHAGINELSFKYSTDASMTRDESGAQPPFSQFGHTQLGSATRQKQAHGRRYWSAQSRRSLSEVS